ncbi:MAG: hypothetical protein LC123_02500, partial [Burkholderiales bacterium]|nr:hypothetical protein [Burkholderiales bacterium]
PILDAEASLLGDASFVVERRGDVVFTDDDLPARDDALALYQDPVTGKPTPFEKFARSALPKASIFYASCFDPSKPLAPLPGQRYTRLRSAAAWASHFLVKADPEVLPIHIYGLFVRSAEQWGDDDDGTPFVERLWTFCQFFHALDVAAVKQRALEAQVEARASHSTLEQMLQGVAEWAPHVRDLEPKAQRKWLLRRLVVSLGSSANYYIMDTTGQYNPVAVIAPKLPSQMAILGLGSLIKLRTDEGKWVPPNEILNAYSTVVANLRYETGNVRARIEHEGLPTATLIFGSYARRDDLEPEWSDDVDGWIEALAGPRYETLCEYLGHVPAFDEGALPMLSIAGPPDIGKNLLVRGIAETLQVPMVADADALFGNWNEQLLRTPIVHIDEGFGLKHMKHPADRLREAIGTQDILIKRRFYDTGTIRTNLRVILTANDANVLTSITLGNDLNEYAQRALTERVIHINGRAAAARYLASRGGVRFTRGWIRGEGGQPSRYVLAKHILKLHEMTAASRTSRTTRFLMSGVDERHRDVASERARRLQVGATPTVAMAIFRMLNVIGADIRKQGNRFDKLWVDEERGAVWILSGAISDYMRTDDFFSPKDWPNTKQIAESVQNLGKPIEGELLRAVSRNSNGRMTLAARRQLGAQYWKVLDVEALLDLSRLEGYPVPLLERLIDGAAVTPIEAAAKVSSSRSTTAKANAFSACRA